MIPPAQVAAQAAPPAAITRHPEASVVQVTLKDGPFLRKGTGLVVGRGLVATNAHVVSGPGSLTVSLGDQRWTAALFRRDDARDLVLLRVPLCPLPAVELADPEAAREGQKVVALGFPGGETLTRSEGRIRAVWSFKGDRLLQADTLTRPGSSGGGLFDEEGRLVGITTFAYPDRPSATFALPGQWVMVLSAQPPAPEAAPVTPGLATDFAAAMAAEPSNWQAWERFCRTWTQEAPDSLDAWMALGHALTWSDRRLREQGGEPPASLRRESQAAYARALELRGAHAKTWNNLGASLEADNRFPEAEDAFRKALDLDPGYALAWINLGSTYFNTARFAAAAEALQTGLKGLPDHAQAWGRLGYACLRLRRFEEAREALVVATRYLPFRKDLWEDLAAAARGAKDPATAALAQARLKALRS